jgi:NAD+ synthase (glutamine-hydrolysing)
MEPFRIAVARMVTLIGDISENAARVIEWIHETRGEGADLVCFPELALTGYPPEDLPLNSDISMLLREMASIHRSCVTEEWSLPSTS